MARELDKLTDSEVRKLKTFLDQMAPQSERPLTVVESGGPALIPLTRFTDPRYFPAYSYQAYPRALNRPAIQADLDKHLVEHRFVDTGTRELSYTRAPMQLGQLVPHPA